MGTLNDLYNIGEEIYSQSSYRWDGSSRPILQDYLDPWSKYANFEEASSLYKKSRHYNNAIRYAKTQLETAAAQYEQDLAYWNELDERNYTSQSAQRQRYEEAGFNLGYLYNQVDSGNSAVGYNQGSVSIDPNDTSNKSLEQSKVVSDIVTSIVSAASSLLSSGVKFAELPSKIAQMKSNTDLNKASLEWINLLRSVDKDGNKVDSITDSIAFELQSLAYEQSDNSLKCSQEQLSQLKEFTKHCASIYELQGTDPRKESSKALQDMIKSIDLSWLGEAQGLGRFILQMLGYTAVLNL